MVLTPNESLASWLVAGAFVFSGFAIYKKRSH
jgi:hypothetical protein